MNLATNTWISLATFIFGLSLMGTMYWLEKNPRRDLRPRLMPTTLFLLIGLLLTLGAGFHLLHLLSPQTALN